MIKFINVSKKFNDQIIFDGLNYEFKDHQTYFINGPSGIGKTTLLRLILDLDKQDQGEIIRDQVSFGVVFQENRLIEHLDAIKNIEIVYPNLGSDIIESHLKLLLPEDQIRKPIKEFSGGMKRKVALVRACIGNQNTIILDEPFTGLDDLSLQQAIDYLTKQINNRTCIIASHIKPIINSYIELEISEYQLSERGIYDNK